jgi:phosphatidylglycerophosphatase A
MTRALPVWHPAFLIATWFGSGLLPGPKGTWGTLATLPAAWLVLWLWGGWALAAAALALFAAGVWASGVYSQASGIKDPQDVVVDESAGITLALVPAAPDSLWQIALAFFAFRFFDTMKPGPIGALERQPGGWGVMLDDLGAGVATAAIVFVATLVIG